MTDNEIIKALNDADGLNHVSLYCADNKGKNATPVKVGDIVNLINRQKAEVERLKEPLRKLSEIGYCHNFQLERSDLVSWIYAVCDVIKVANKLTEGDNG
jgi:hypothetical protein